MGLQNCLIILLLSKSIIAGNADAEPKIVNGTNADISEFSFIVSLEVSGSHYCAGSLIDEYWILTAGSNEKLNEILEGMRISFISQDIAF